MICGHKHQNGKIIPQLKPTSLNRTILASNYAAIENLGFLYLMVYSSEH